MHRALLSPLAGVAASLLLAPRAQADLTFPDFTGATGLTLNGDAALAGSRLRLAPATPNQRGAAFATDRQRVTTPFVAEFTFEMTGGGEGLAFVIQNTAADALGLGGEGLGYAGMTNAFVLEFDTVSSLLMFDIGDNEVSAHTGGAGPVSANELGALGSTTLAPDLNGGQRTVRIEYVPGSMRVFVDDTIPTLQVAVDLGATLSSPDGRAWVGFTGATSLTVQNHDVLSLSFIEDALTTNGNLPPLAPPINEPVGGGALQNPFDVHMEAGPFSDPDASGHACSDYEIWTMLNPQRVWRTDCIAGPERVHTHLGDGAFMGTHTGRTELLAQTAYVLRVRFKDGSGDAPSEWSPWSERAFQTGAASTVYPLDTEDIVQDPAPQWLSAASGTPVVFAQAAPQHSLRLESPFGALLLGISGSNGASNAVANPAPLPQHVDVKLVIQAGGDALNLGPTDLVIVTDDCQRVRVLRLRSRSPQANRSSTGYRSTAPRGTSRTGRRRRRSRVARAARASRGSPCSPATRSRSSPAASACRSTSSSRRPAPPPPRRTSMSPSSTATSRSSATTAPSVRTRRTSSGTRPLARSRARASKASPASRSTPRRATSTQACSTTAAAAIATRA